MVTQEAPYVYFYPTLRLRSRRSVLVKADAITMTTVVRPARPRKAMKTSTVVICMSVL